MIAIEQVTMNPAIGNKRCSSANGDTVKMLIEMRADGVSLEEISKGAHLMVYMKNAKNIELIANEVKNNRNFN